MDQFESARKDELWYAGREASGAVKAYLQKRWPDLKTDGAQDVGFGFLTFIIMRRGRAATRRGRGAPILGARGP